MAGRVLKVTDNGSLDLYEDHDNGSHRISLKAPAALAADVTLELPADAGTAGYLLKTDGAGVLSWEPSTATEEFAEITLLDQGRISLREAVGNGTNFVGFRAPASLAASIDFTMPNALPGATLFLSCDVTGQWAYAAGTSTLQSAYDEGEDVAIAAGTPIAITQANDEDALTITKAGTGAGRLLSLEDDGTGGCILITQTGDGVALEITKVAGAANVVTIAPTGAISGAGARITMPSAGSGIGLDVANDGSGIGLRGTQATTDAILAQLNQGTISHALDVNRTSVDAATLAALDVSDAATGTASAVNISKESGSGGSALTINQGNASTGLLLTQSTNGIAARIAKSGTGAGTALEIENDGTGRGLTVQQDGIAIAVLIDQNAAAVGLSVDMAATDEAGIQITHAGGTESLANDIRGTDGRWAIRNDGRARFGRFGMTEASHIISGGSIVLGVGGLLVVDTEGSASTDNLDTITTTGGSPFVVGDIIVIRAQNDARTVVITESGNFKLIGGANVTLDNTGDLAMFIYLGSWTQLAPLADIGA